MNGSVVHFEIPADDVPRAESFYRDAFGWKTSSIPDMGYTVVSTAPSDVTGASSQPGAINGGMLPRQGPITAPVVTIGVDDVDSALATVERLGGRTTIGRQAVGGMGYSAYFTDTEGNLVGLWQSVPPGEDGTGS